VSKPILAVTDYKSLTTTKQEDVTISYIEVCGHPFVSFIFSLFACTDKGVFYTAKAQVTVPCTLLIEVCT